MPSFLGGKSRGAFQQPAFFLAGNRMINVAFQKRFLLKLKVVLYSKKVMLGCKSHFFLNGKIVNFKHLVMLS